MTIYADKIILGKIYTAEKIDPDSASRALDNIRICEAMAIRDGRYLAVGSRQEVFPLQGPDTELTEYTEGLILPGMTEGHAHVTNAVDMLFGVDLFQGKTLASYQAAVAAFRAEHPELDCIIGNGYITGAFGEQGPTAAMLDEVVSDIPVVLTAEDIHSQWINTRAMELLGLDREVPQIASGEVVLDPATGKPTGYLKEAAMELTVPVLPKFQPDHYKQAILHFQENALREGITNAFEPMFDVRADYDLRSDAYLSLAEDNRLLITFRSGMSIKPERDVDADFQLALNLREKLSGQEKTALTTIKLFADGVVEGHNAALLAPYSDDGTIFETIWNQQDFDQIVLRARRQGFNVHIHSIGDAAAALSIHGIASAEEKIVLEKGPSKPAPNAMTHLQILQKDQMQRMQELGIHGTVNPYWHYPDPAYYQEIELPYLGAERAEREYPMASLCQAGVSLSQASDWPVTVPAHTFDSLHLMVNRQKPGQPDGPVLGPSERLSVSEALYLLTMGGACQLGLSEKKGSITIDKDADFVIINNDVLTMEPQRIYETRVLSTYVHGQKV